MTPLLGFTPDAPTTSPGIIIDCSQFIPYESGMQSAPGATPQGSSALGAATRGGIMVRGLDGTAVVVVGTTAALYTLAGTTFTDRSRGGGYSLSSDVFWSIAQFGNDTYASNTNNVIQKRTAMSGSFADVSGAPQAKIIVSMLTSGGGFLFAFNTEVKSDQWKCSALNDANDWTVNPTVTQCNTGRLLGENGPITAAAQLGTDLIVAYKNRSIYVGSYAGTPSVWEFREIPGAGCVGPNAMVTMDTMHFFVGEDNFYLFDGSRPIPIGDGQVRQWFINNSNPNFRYATQCVYDRDARRVWVYFCSEASSTPDKCLVYHLTSKQWGRADRLIECAFPFATPSQSIDGLGSTAIDSLTGSIDGLAGGGGTRVVAFFNTAHTMQLLSNTSEASYFRTADIGDDSQMLHMSEFVLRYMALPSTALLNAYYSDATGGTATVGRAQFAYDVPANGLNKFPLRQTARFHSFQPNFTGNVKVIGYDVKFTPRGLR